MNPVSVNMPEAGIHIEKEIMRQRIRSLNALQDPVQLAEWAEIILRTLEALPEFSAARNILLYSAIKGEVPTADFIAKWAELKNIVLPRVVSETEMELRKYEKDRVQTGRFSIVEPNDKCELIDPCDIDLAVIPGMAFAPCPPSPSIPTSYTCEPAQLCQAGKPSSYFQSCAPSSPCQPPRPGISSGYFRLGRGKGYYDRLLTKLTCSKIGICFPYQLLPSLPVCEFDLPVDKCIYV